jgi:hypothetical protein
VIATPAGEPAPNANQIYLSGDVTPAFVPGKNFQFSTVITDNFYRVQSASYNAVKNFTLVTAATNFVSTPGIGQNTYTVSNGFTVWQQEYGYNAVSDDGTLAIPASMTTCDISWIGGTPAQDTAQGVNRRIHLRRVEPDFLQTGDMTLQIAGRGFARGQESLSQVFNFGPNDGKVDMRVENRESRLVFGSNTINGNFEMGRIMITAEYGDERP